MKKQLVSILTAGCLMAAMVPAAFAADTNDLQEQINNAPAGSTVTLSADTTITDTLVIDKALTLNGNKNTLTFDGSGYAIQVTTDAEVNVTNLTVEAEASGGRGIEITSTNPHFKLCESTLDVNNRGIGFADKGTTAGAEVTIKNSTIQSSLKPDDKTYENWSHQGDSRGIGFWDNKGLTMNIIGSRILGFGYPINMSGDMVNDVRDMENATINITDSDIWGWCAMNIWTINTTFNITNSDLKGFVETDNSWNSFATIVLNTDIYKGVTDPCKANVFNISGGSVSSTCVSNVEEVYHCLFRLDKEFMSEFNFSMYNFERVMLSCNSPFSAFVMTYDGMTLEDFEAWAEEKLTLEEDSVVYDKGIAPGVDVDPFALTMVANDILNPSESSHEGGFNQ